MEKKFNFFIVDDDQSTVDIYRQLITKAGYEATTFTSSQVALEQIINQQPSCVVCDLMMPDISGLELLRQVRETPNIKQPKFIIVTTKPYDFDRRLAFSLGVDGYLYKPIDIDTFVSSILEITRGDMILQFWGVRGTLPAPGKFTLRYGGNTNCVTLAIAKKHFFIFDAGTGIKLLGDHLLKNKLLPISAKIFITHPHYDHINGIPFFKPLYIKGNEFVFYGAAQGAIGMEELIAKQMDSVYFPITMSEFSASIGFQNLKEEAFDVDGVACKSILLNHPGTCLGYRIDHSGKSFCYITDNELFLPGTPRYNQSDDEKLIRFVEKTDVLIIDATYSDEEYGPKTGWGHSSVSRAVEIAHHANVKLLCLFHHDPGQTDVDITAKVNHANVLLRSLKSKTRCSAPREGDILPV